MTEKRIKDLGMSGQDAVNVLTELVTTGELKMADAEAALSRVKKAKRSSSREKDSSRNHKGSSFFSSLKKRVSAGKPTPEEAAAAKRGGKGRQKVKAKRVDVHKKSVKIPVYEKSQEAVDFLTTALTNDTNFLFASLKPDELLQLIDAMAPHDAKAETIIIKQGDIGDYFYVLQDGRVGFQVDGNDVGNCGPGASFGELALLYDSPRAATCVADTDCTLWKVDQSSFRYMLAKQQDRQHNQINSILMQVPFLSELEDSALSKIVDALTSVHFKKGCPIFKKGEVGETFYIIENGKAKIHDIGFGDTKFDDVDIGSGAFFGERALLTGEPRAANVTATTECTCLTLSRESFETTLGPLQDLIDRAMTKRVLISIPSFKAEFVTPREVDRLLDKMQKITYKKGEIIMEEGEPLKHAALQIIRQGKVTIVSAKGEINNLQNGGHFGESTLPMKEGDAGLATVNAIEDTVCDLLTRDAVEAVIGSISKLGKARSLINARATRARIPYKNLKKIRILGLGAFGKVWLVADKTTNKAYALKLMDKRQCIEQQQHEGVIREKNILANIDHPFLLTMWASYQDDDNLMMVLDLIQGGELFSVVHAPSRDGVSNPEAVFYASCVLEGIGHLHERNIAYRDLKPENALIDSKGYCIVVDFGFAKVITSKAYTLCGTPEYLAPEIILSKGHNKGVDYWAFGVLIYEMLVGRSPFFSNDQMRMFKKIVQAKFEYPANRQVSAEADDLMKALLLRRQAKRLGNLKDGHLDVQKHPWFKNIDLKRLLAREIAAPWKPNIKNALDSSNFDDFSSMEKEDTETKPKIPSKHQAVFEEFGEYL